MRDADALLGQSLWPAVAGAAAHPLLDPHVEAEGVPVFLLGAVVGAAGWLLVDATLARRARRQEDTPDEGVDRIAVAALASADGPLVSGRGAARPRRQAPVSPTIAPSRAKADRPSTPRLPDSPTRPRLTRDLVLRLLTLALGIVLARMALDYAHGVAGVAVFGQLREVALAARVVDLFAALAVAGAVLALPAPRWAALAFGGTALLGAALGLASLYRDGLGLADSALSVAFFVPWQDQIEWAVFAAALALFSWSAHARADARPEPARPDRRAARHASRGGAKARSLTPDA